MARLLVAGLLVAAVLAGVHSQDIVPVNVTTTKGVIVGKQVTSTSGLVYDAFLGVPYGEKPVRFQIPVAKGKWTGQKTTQTDGPACPQPGMKFDEDCLYLNVFTPQGASTGAIIYPVMVFIHGSAFTTSSSSSLIYGPDFLVPNGVILVTLNYRLGAAGFLTLGSNIAPGNLGLHDSLLALQWVQDEISNFKGDPKQVTLFGQSAGSVMTHFHYLSSLSTNLFIRAIGQSGSALSFWGHITPAEGARRAKLLAKGLGCNTTKGDAAILDCLQKADINDVVTNQSIAFPLADVVPGNYLPFVPVLDTYKTSGVPFFNDSLTNLMKKAVARGKPFMTGFTTGEGIVMFNPSVNMQSIHAWEVAEANLAAFIPSSTKALISEDDSTNLAASIKKRYFPSAVDQNKVQDLVDIFTDYLFAYPSVKMTRYFANLTYGYVFAHAGTWNPVSAFFAHYNMIGVGHGAEIPYLFYISGNPQSLDICAPNKPEVDLKTVMASMWTSFAKTGIPDTTWGTVSTTGYRVIDNTPTTLNVTAMESRYYQFWASIENANSASSARLSLLTVFIALWTVFSTY